MKKSTLFSILTIFLLVPATLLLGRHIKGRWYYLTSTLVIIEIMLPFFASFESRKPQSRELVTLAVMAALATASRVAFVFIPYFKAITGVIMITGIAFGAQAGFLTGAIAAFASNFFKKYMDQSSTTEGSGFIRESNYKYSRQRFGISVSYRIGELKASVKKAARTISNDDVKSGGSGSGGGGE